MNLKTFQTMHIPILKLELYEDTDSSSSNLISYSECNFSKNC